MKYPYSRHDITIIVW